MNRTVSPASDIPLRVVDTPEATDAELVAEARGGARWAIEMLFRRHGPMAFRLASRLLGTRHEVPDVVQDSFLAAMRALNRLREATTFSAWFGQIVVHHVHRVRRRERLLSRIGLRSKAPLDPTSLLSRTAPPDVAADVSALYARVERLPEQQRTAFLMRWIEGRQLDEIARLLDVSVPTVKRLLARAGARLGETGGEA